MRALFLLIPLAFALGGPTAELKDAFLADRPVAGEDELSSEARSIQDGRPPEEAEDQFRKRLASLARKLSLDPKETEAAEKLYLTRLRSAAVLKRHTELQRVRQSALRPDSADRLGQAGAEIAARLGRSQLIEDGGSFSPSPGGPGQRTVKEVIAEASRLPRAHAPSVGRVHSRIGHLHILDDTEAAPAPTLFSRVAALAMPDEELIQEDLATLRSKVRALEVPDDMTSLGSNNLEAPKQFAGWIKSSPQDIPPISYGTLPEGVLARYKPGLLGKGSIVMNHTIRHAEPEARSAVLMHELYHYWDVKVSGNSYPNVSYNHHSEAGIARREYDAYRLTVLYWKQAKPQSATSALSRSLSRLPEDPEEIQRRVDGLVARREDNE